MIRATHFATALVLACSLSCGDDDETPSEGLDDDRTEVRELVLEAAPPEGGSEPLFGPAEAELSDALRRLEAVRRDEDAKGLLLWVGPMGGSWGRIDDLVDRVQAIRDAHKPVHCHFTVADNLAYAFMAKACDRISMTPAGDLELVGVSAHLFYVRSLLANVGLRADLLQIGRYKGAADPFTMDAPSDEVREDIRDIVDLPDRRLDLFIRLAGDNHGTLGAKKRTKYFPELTDDEVARMEAVVREGLPS